MTTPAYEIAQFLHAHALGVFAGQPSDEWSINVSQEPTTPDETITLYDRGGPAVDTDDQDLQTAIVQVRVRSRDYMAAYAKHGEIRDLIIRTTPLQLDTLYFVGAEMTGNISSEGRDDNDRHILVAAYEALRQL